MEVLKFEGQFLKGCPYELVGVEVLEAVGFFEDWEHGHQPVTLGHASWVPPLFAATMRFIRAVKVEDSRGSRA